MMTEEIYEKEDARSNNGCMDDNRSCSPSLSRSVSKEREDDSGRSCSKERSHSKQRSRSKERLSHKRSSRNKDRGSDDDGVSDHRRRKRRHRSRSSSSEEERSSRRRRRRRSSSSDRRRRSRSRDDDRGVRVHVGNLHENVGKRDLDKMFGKYGSLYEIWMARSSPCFAFVVFRHRSDAEKAVDALDGSDLFRRRIRVSIARPRSGSRYGYSSSSYKHHISNLRCYQCGEFGHLSRQCSLSYTVGYKRPASPDNGSGSHRRRSSDYDRRRSSRSRSR